MSVIASKRQTAFSEFERQAILLCQYTSDRLKRVPARYKKFINPKIYNPANKALTALICANEESSKTPDGKARRTAYFEEAVRELGSLQQPLIAAWNVLEIEEDSTQRWANHINRVFALVWGVTKWNEETMPMIIHLPKKKMRRLEFLKTMAELHRYTYVKIGHAPQYCKDTLSEQIAGFVDTALCEVVLANHKEPATQSEAKERAAHVQAAIRSLNGMQRPLLALWLIQDYSENEMNDWSGLIDKEIKLLEGLKRSDTARFKNLK